MSNNFGHFVGAIFFVIGLVLFKAEDLSLSRLLDEWPGENVRMAAIFATARIEEGEV